MMMMFSKAHESKKSDKFMHIFWKPMDNNNASASTSKLQQFFDNDMLQNGVTEKDLNFGKDIWTFETHLFTRGRTKRAMEVTNLPGDSCE